MFGGLVEYGGGGGWELVEGIGIEREELAGDIFISLGKLVSYFFFVFI